MLRKRDVKLQILAVSTVTLLIKNFVQCKLTCKTWLSFCFCFATLQSKPATAVNGRYIISLIYHPYPRLFMASNWPY